MLLKFKRTFNIYNIIKNECRKYKKTGKQI